MTKTAEIRLRVDPTLKEEASELFKTWGMNLSDAITVFLTQSVRVGGLPFDLKREPAFAWNSENIIRVDAQAGYAVLPAELDEGEDLYDDFL